VTGTKVASAPIGWEKGQAGMAKRERDAKSPGISRITVIGMAVVMAIGLTLLIVQAARRLVMVFEAAG
jgi:hypothetical protein